MSESAPDATSTQDFYNTSGQPDGTAAPTNPDATTQAGEATADAPAVDASPESEVPTDDASASEHGAIGGDVPHDEQNATDDAQQAVDEDAEFKDAAEGYEPLKVPKGYALPRGALENLTERARTAKMDQAGFQSAFDFSLQLLNAHASGAQVKEARVRAAAIAKADEECKADPEFGGDKYNATGKAMNSLFFDTMGGAAGKAELVTLMRTAKLPDGSSIANNALMRRAFARMARGSATARANLGDGTIAGATQHNTSANFYRNAGSVPQNS